MKLEDDSTRFTTGRGAFVDDLRLEGMQHLKVVRSPYARARILKVSGGITSTEFSRNMPAVGEGAWGGTPSVPCPVLPSHYVSYVGQPVAAVVADDPYEAEDAMEEVEVEYDPLKPLIDPEEAMTSEPIHPGARSNIADSIQLGQEFDIDAPIILEDEFANARITPNPMEPRGMVASYDGSRLTVWSSTQSVHTWRVGISQVMHLPPEAVRVIAMDTGGAFGSKSALYPEYAIACYASMKSRRPVKWVESRAEHLQATSQGRGARARMKFFADRDGRVLGVKADLLIDSGAFAVGIGAAAPRFIGYQITGPYTIQKVFVRGNSVYTNKVPLGPYRGAGRPEAAFFVERMMDLLADRLKLDPVEVRLRNASPEEFTSPLGLKIDPLKPFLESAVESLGYKSRCKKREPIGFSCFVLVSAVQPGESAKIAVREGRVKVWMGGSQGGQEHEIIAKELVSKELGVPRTVIDLEHGDTDQLDEGLGTWGSRSAVVGGAALIEASRKLKEQATRELGDYSVEKLLQLNLSAIVFHRETEQVNSLGANLVNVSVDDAGQVRVKECLAFYDAGKVLNPPMVDGQIIGGTAQGVGQVLYEEAKYDENGQVLTGASIADAGLLSSTQMPYCEVKLANLPLSRPHGAKGIGEAATIGVPPALIRAIEVAIGRRLSRTPVHPQECIS
jgi:carbon-monoxide dehydrogenase large subunit